MSPQRVTVPVQDRSAGAVRIAALFAAAAVALHMAFAGRYGYFRDELYFLACTEHLAFGYVDHAPLIEWLFWPFRALLGDSLHAIRLLPALSGAAKLILTGLITRELGGGRFAVALACLGVLLAPIYLGMDHLLTMNTLEPLWWMGAVYALLLAIKRDDPSRLAWFGVTAGLGLLTKHSTAFFIAALIGGLLLTRERRLVWNRWMWVGGAVALLLVLPHLIWQVQNGWPILETLQTVKRTGKNVPLGPGEYALRQVLLLGPGSLLLWLPGLVWLLRRSTYLGLAYVLALGIMIALGGKDYYLAPAYPMLFGAGGIVWERVSSRVARGAVVAAVTVLGAITVPLVLPVLSPEGYLAYAKALHFEQPKTERGHRGPLPQQFGDMFGWPEMVDQVAQVYHALPPHERVKAAIYATNYGVAGAVDLLGPSRGLPKAISGHNNYWLWGPRDYSGDVVIILNGRADVERKHFESVEVGPRVGHRWAMAYEHWNILICRGIRRPLKEVWPETKFYN